MSINDWNEIGNEIRDAVQDSLRTGDFQQLGNVLSGTVNSAVTEAKRQIEQARDYLAGGGQEGNGNGGQGGSGGPGKSGNGGQGGNGGPGTASRPFYEQQANRKRRPRIKFNRVGKVSGVLYMVFGGIGLGITAILLLLLGLGFSILWDVTMLPPLAVIVALLLACIILIRRGCANRDRLKRADRYLELCGHCSYINIEDLALHTGKSERYVLKDVKKMLRLGMFPEGHLDQEETCLILDDATYRQYLSLQKERKAREMEERAAAQMRARMAGDAAAEQNGAADGREQQLRRELKQQMEQEGSQQTQPGQEKKSRPEWGQRAAKEEPEEIQDPALAAMIREGQDCIRRLRDMNDNIEGEVISAKLFRLENLLKEIFQRVREHPEQMPQMQKFMNYYLPTTLKLVEAYEEFDSVSAPGEDILQAKAEIEKTLDTINQAFEELLNKLFTASVFDATTDAQVLQTMLAREGLTGNKEFEKALH